MVEKKVKIVHLINSNGLFLSWIKKAFSHQEISNQFIILNAKSSNNRSENGDLHCDLEKTGKGLALEAINDSDIVIHYFLDYTKSELILKSNEDIKHIWYFFGADVYQQLNIFRKKLYGVKTRKWMRFSISYRFRLELRAVKYFLFKQRLTPRKNLLNSFQRIDKVLWYIEDEIKWINTKIKTPPFSYFKYFTFDDVIPFKKGIVDISKKNILVGNSAALENNHLDVLSVFKENNLTDYNVSLPLTYGEPKKYKQFVKQEFSTFLGSKFKSQEVSLPLVDYYNWLKDFPTAVMLHYRQQALGNIFYLIANGSKVYLSKKNILLDWFVKNNINVYCFEKDFVNDYKQNNLTLDLERQQSNYTNLKKVLSKESEFISEILKEFK